MFVAKNRLAIFEVRLGIHDLTNMPLPIGRYYAKYRLQGTTGATPKKSIKHHAVYWEYQARHRVEMIIGKDGLLSSCMLVVKVKREERQGKSSTMGVLNLDLSQYAALPNEVSRRYLLEDSKVNSNIRISVNMSLLEECDPFRTPPINRAQFLSELDEIATDFSCPGGPDVSSTTANSHSSHTTSLHKSGIPTTLSNGESRSFLPIDDSDLEDLAPFKRSAKKNDDIIDNLFSKPRIRPLAAVHPKQRAT
ncbi:hypothetical protein H4219_000135 [Mycoemilia scoparia]|uniref:C2 NT-type domain-containing protein n=1 Tax=Mycoemilia scoparia TaxID=417184 RepID=A0A9W8A3V3_9FUNG|nr:hypothetical protein H4219_000135 [Mycoemilia scoparia]